MRSNKEISEEYSIIKLRDKLTLCLFDEQVLKGKLNYSGTKRNGGFKFYISQKNSDIKNKYKVDFNFSIIYENELDISEKFERENDITNMSYEEYNEKLYDTKQLKYVVIDGLYIRPTNTGFGTKFIHEFIKEVKKIKSLDIMYLYPESSEDKRFWVRNGFIDCELFSNGIYDKPFGLSDYNMILKLR